MTPISNNLSLWEISHRWFGVDPNKTDPENLSLDTQDSLRFLARLILAGRIPLLDEVFTTNTEAQSTNRYDHLIFEAPEIPKAYEECVFRRKYDKSILDAYLINQADLFRCCVMDDLPFPDFWFDDNLAAAVGASTVSKEVGKEQREASKQSARQSVLDKELCQTIARTLWDIYPDTRIAQMAKHKAIQQYGNGRQYQGKHTLQDWLSEVAPSHIKNRPGRPKKKSTDGAA